MSDCLVSVILPNYNNGNVIRHAIDSVLEQTYASLELSVVDDGSTDNSLSIIDSFVKKDRRVKPIYLNNNYGRSYARNMAINKSIGRYLAFIDADDIWYKSKLEKQSQLLNDSDHEFMGVCTGYSIFSNYQDLEKYDRIISLGVNKLFSEDLRYVNPIALSTAIIDKSKIGDCKFQSGYREDYKYWVCVLKKGMYFSVIKESLVHYHSPKGSSLFIKKTRNAKEQYKIYKNYYKYNTLKSVYYFFVYVLLSIKKYL